MSVEPDTNGCKSQYLSSSRSIKQNVSPNGWIVQKFGGSSVGKFAINIAADIVKYTSLTEIEVN